MSLFSISRWFWHSWGYHLPEGIDMLELGDNGTWGHLWVNSAGCNYPRWQSLRWYIQVNSPGRSAVSAMTLSEEQLAFVLQEGMVPQQQVNTGVIGVVGGWRSQYMERSTYTQCVSGSKAGNFGVRTQKFYYIERSYIRTHKFTFPFIRFEETENILRIPLDMIVIVHVFLHRDLGTCKC